MRCNGHNAPMIDHCLNNVGSKFGKFGFIIGASALQCLKASQRKAAWNNTVFAAIVMARGRRETQKTIQKVWHLRYCTSEAEWDSLGGCLRLCIGL
jgi:hypothetical protein